MKDAGHANALVVIPTLNEADHIDGLLDQVVCFAERERTAGRGCRIVVVDGGSVDGTQGLVTSHRGYAENLVDLLHNPDRVQSAGINLAVTRHGENSSLLFRLDAHARYPDDYCDILAQEAEATGADSVVVAMHAVGTEPVQTAIAQAQNSSFGNGGASHRKGTGGRFVDHGHHALMRLDAFRSVGGYDPAFSHNEDAELDHRLVNAGYRVWQTTRVGVEYVPRRSLGALARQYANFGAGRARTFHKHKQRMRLRQIAVASLAPGLALVVLTPVWAGFVIPLVLWLVAVVVCGLVLVARGSGVREGLTAGLAAGVMHLSWSVGFWSFLLGSALMPRMRG